MTFPDLTNSSSVLRRPALSSFPSRPCWFNLVVTSLPRLTIPSFIYINSLLNLRPARLPNQLNPCARRYSGRRHYHVEDTCRLRKQVRQHEAVRGVDRRGPEGGCPPRRRRQAGGPAQVRFSSGRRLRQDGPFRRRGVRGPPLGGAQGEEGPPHLLLLGDANGQRQGQRVLREVVQGRDTGEGQVLPPAWQAREAEFLGQRHDALPKAVHAPERADGQRYLQGRPRAAKGFRPDGQVEDKADSRGPLMT